MLRQHKIISIALALILGVTLGMSGCKEPEDEKKSLQPLIYHTISVKNDNSLARNSVADIAVRYFYLINNGEYELANELIDRTDLSICTPEILEELYSNVLNFELNSDNRVVAVHVDDNRARLTFINLNDTELSFDPEYDEENPAPSWFKSPNPYVQSPYYANTYEIEDVNQDGVIDETDMQWEDHPELNPDYDPEEYYEDEDYDTPATGANTMTYKTTATSAKAESSNNQVKAFESSNNQAKASESSNNQAKASESSNNQAKAFESSNNQAKASEFSNNQSKASESSNNQSKAFESSNNQVKASEGSAEKSDAKKDINDIGSVDISKDIKTEESVPIVKDVLPDDLYEEEEIVGYKTYTMDIYVTPYTSGFKVKLPTSMTTQTRLMIKVPYDMKIKVGDLELNESMMNLDDFYVIDKLPKVEKFTVELDNLMLGHSKKELDLTKRVYYIYSNLVPTKELKDQSLAYIRPALQQYYNDLLSGVKFENSTFLKEYLYKGYDLETVRYRYNKYQLENSASYEDDDSKVIMTYYIRKIRFPSAETDSADELSVDRFRVTSYYYVEVPIYLTIDVQTVEGESKQLETIEIGGIVRLTKDNDKLYVWELDDALALLD